MPEDFMICEHCQGTGSRQFTKQEKAIVRLVASGCSNQLIATELGVTLRAVKEVLRRVYKKAEIDHAKFDPRVRLAFMITQGQIPASVIEL